VDITSHASPRPIVAGGEVQYKASTDVMKSLDLQQFADQLRTIEATLVDIEAGRNPVGQFIQGDTMYRDLERRLTQLQGGLRRAVNTAGAVGQMVYSDALYRQIAVPLTDLDRALARFESAPIMRDSGQYEQFLKAAVDLRKSIAGVRAGALFQSDALYAAWNANLNALNSSPQFTSSETYDSFTGWAREMENSVRDFREHPQKYLRLKVF